MAVSKAIGFLELNIQGFQQALDTAKRAMAVFAAGISAYKGFQFLKDGVKDAIDFGNAAYFAAQQVGKADPGKFLIMQKALENVGYSAEQARATIKEFVESGKPLETIFGGSTKYGQALTNATAQYGAQAKILSESAARFSKVFESLQAVGGKLREFFLGMTAQFLKPLQTLLETIQKIDLASIGARFGKYVAAAINTLNGLIASGDLGKSIELSFKVGSLYIKQAIENIGPIFDAAAESIVEIIVSGLGSIDWPNLAYNFGASLYKVIIGIFETAATLFTKAVLFAVSVITGLDTKNRQDEVTGIIKQYFDEARGGVNEILMENSGPLIDKSASSLWTMTIADIKGKFSDLAKTLGDSPELKAAKDALGALAEKARKAGEEQAKNAPEKQGFETNQRPDAFKVIADSLARVGGGGGVIRVGQTVQEKQLMVQQRIQQEITRAANAIEKWQPAAPISMQFSTSGVNF